MGDSRSIAHARQEHRQHQPDQGSCDHRTPVVDRGRRYAGNPVDPEQQELIQRQQGKHGRRELGQRKNAHEQVELDRDVDDDAQSESMLTQHCPMCDIEYDSDQPGDADAIAARYSNGPENEYQGDPVGPE
jgi:hypothetical protein